MTLQYFTEQTVSQKIQNTDTDIKHILISLLLNMNTIYIGKFRYTPMITSQNSIRNVSVATDEGPSPKLALSEDGSRGNIES